MRNYKTILSNITVITIAIFAYSCNGGGTTMTGKCDAPGFYNERECPKEYEVCGHGQGFAVDPVLAEEMALGDAFKNLAAQTEIYVASKAVRKSQDARSKDGLEDAVAALVQESSFASEITAVVKGGRLIKDQTVSKYCAGDSRYWIGVGMNEETIDFASIINRATAKAKNLNEKEKQLLNEVNDWSDTVFDDIK